MHTPHNRWVIRGASWGGTTGEDIFNAAKHGGTGPRFSHLSAIDFHLDAQVAFNTTDRIDNHTVRGVIDSGIIFDGGHVGRFRCARR